MAEKFSSSGSYGATGVTLQLCIIHYLIVSKGEPLCVTVSQIYTNLNIVVLPRDFLEN